MKSGNKELLLTNENQKNRGLYIGIFFAVMGLIILFYDFTL